MAGIRLHHPTARSGVFTFTHKNRPYRVPLVCIPCGASHAAKTYHINVDHDGFAIVSHEVWEMMKRYDTAGFSMANEVDNPPTQGVGFTAVTLASAQPLE